MKDASVAKDASKNRDIKNLLVVLGSAVVCAFLLAFVFIYYYGPSGHYLAGHTILDPAIIKQINYQENDPLTGKKVHFLFDKMEFSYFDAQKGLEKKQIVSPSNYQKFYQLIASDVSVSEDSLKLEELFRKSRSTVLTISMRTMNGSGTGSAKIFQMVQFVQEDHFRVQLHERQEQGEWVYFTHPHIYQETMNLFTKAAGL